MFYLGGEREREKSSSHAPHYFICHHFIFLGKKIRFRITLNAENTGLEVGV
jgi:hypothetical protein